MMCQEGLQVPVEQLQVYDIFYSPRERGGHVSGSHTVQRVTVLGDLAYVTIAAGAYTDVHPYPLGTMFSVDRWAE